MVFTPSSEADFLISVEDWDLFQTISAVEKSGESTPVFDGGSLRPYILGGRATAKPFEVSRPFDRFRDMGRYGKYLPLINAVYLQVTIMPTNNQLQRDANYFSGRALLQKIMMPAASNASRESAPTVPMVSLTLWAPDWGVNQ